MNGGGRAVVVAPNRVAEREENPAEQHHAEKKSDEMPTLQYPVSSAAIRVSPSHSLLLPPGYIHPLRNDIHRQREHDRRVLLDADLRQRLQIAKLDGRRLLLQNLRRIRQFCRGFKLALGVNNLGPALALCLRLLGDGALHVLRNIDLFDLNLRYLDTPRLRILVKDLLQLGVNLFALGEDGVQFKLAYQAAKRRLSELGSCVQIILDLREGKICIHHAKIADGVYLHRDVVARDYI